MKNLVKKLATVSFIGLLMLLTNMNADATRFTSSEVTTIESTLIVENWMKDDSLWKTGVNFLPETATETENSLEVEVWMINDMTWNSTETFTEFETYLELEDWMITNENWDRRHHAIDPELEIEDWMINDNTW